MKITVMGPGGVGGYFGARLAAAGNDVTFVARGAHLEAMKAKGLRLDSEIGDSASQPGQGRFGCARYSRSRRHHLRRQNARHGERRGKPQAAGRRGRGNLHFPERRGERGTVGKIVGAGNVVEGAARIGSQHSRSPASSSRSAHSAILEFGERDGKPSARVDALFMTPAWRPASTPRCPTTSQRDAMDEVRHAGTALRHDGADARADRPVRTNAQSCALLKAAVEEAIAVGVALKTGCRA